VIGRLARRLRRSDTFKVTLGNGLGAGLGLAVLLVLSRALGAGGYGRVAPMLAVIDLGQLLIDTLLAAGVVTVASRAMAESDGRNGAANSVRTGFLLRAAAGVIYAALFLLGAEVLAPALFADAPHAAAVVRLAGFSGGVMAVQSALIGIAQIRQQFTRVALAASYKNLLRLTAIAACLLLGHVELVTLALALTLAGLAAMAATALTVERGGITAGRYDAAAAREMLAINKWMALAAISIVASRIDIMLLSAFSTPEQVAFYAAAMQICIAIGIVSQAIVTTQLPKVSRYHRREDMRDYLARWMRRAPGAIMVVLVMPFLSPWLLPALMGESFAAGHRVFDLLFASSMLTLVMNPVLLVLFPLGSARLFGLTALAQVLGKWAITALVIESHGAAGLAWADITTKLLAAGAILALLSRLLRRDGEPDG
jgi:O-antigen/teichoic acid export membrane protein